MLVTGRILLALLLYLAAAIMYAATKFGETPRETNALEVRYRASSAACLAAGTAALLSILVWR